MVALLLAFLSIGFAIWIGHRTQTFDVINAVSAAIIAGFMSVIILGALSWHDHQETRVYEIVAVVELKHGYAVETRIDNGHYLPKAITTIEYDCEEPRLVRYISETYPYLLGVSIETDSRNTLCLTGDLHQGGLDKP